MVAGQSRPTAGQGRALYRRKIASIYLAGPFWHMKRQKLGTQTTDSLARKMTTSRTLISDRWNPNQRCSKCAEDRHRHSTRFRSGRVLVHDESRHWSPDVDAICPANQR